jgi:hypothetical protein
VYKGFLLAVVIALFSLYCSKNILSQGQEIKQFHAFGITRALVENHFKIFNTYLPCEDIRDHTYPRPWAEEPPIFHVFAASLIRLGITGPQWPSFIVCFLTSLLVVGLISKYRPAGRKHSIFLIAMALGCPVFLRYYSEHMPDTLGGLFTLVAVFCHLAGFPFLVILALTFAVTTKAYAIFPSVTLLLWIYFQDFIRGQRRLGRREAGSLVTYAVAVTIITLPFVIWVHTIDSLLLPNPFDFHHRLENRHSGSWSVLFTAELWDRVFTYIATKGVGWVLFLGYLYAVFGALKNRRQLSDYDGTLLFWSLGAIPFWLLVRSASIVHDHYVLQYFLPMALMGAESVLKLPKKIQGVAILTTLAFGITNPLLWRWRSDSHPQPRSFCEQEEHSLKKFPKGVRHLSGPKGV